MSRPVLQKYVSLNCTYKIEAWLPKKVWFLPLDLLKAVLVDKTATTQLLTVLVESSENAGARAVVVMTFLAV